MFDFETLYRKYSTADLLRVVQQPELYQPAAVKAAEIVLAERNVTSEEYTTIAAVVALEQANTGLPGPVDRAVAKVSSFAKYLFTLSEEFDPRKWVYWVCIALSIRNCSHYPIVYLLYAHFLTAMVVRFPSSVCLSQDCG